ncbi:MAG: hypothetical protein J6P87_01410 [Lachnospiraceae bacterium]|nr:hypothetical protein [Lachnospiraceae bacterium]
MERNEDFLQKAEALKPVLHSRFIKAEGSRLPLKKGSRLCLDFGGHLVGYVTLHLSYTGSHPDAPAWLRLKFAEREQELSENVEAYSGWISAGWVQQEQIHADVLPCALKLPRRYAFRYLQIEVLDVSGKYDLVVESVDCEAVSSADDASLPPYETNDPDLQQIDRIACRTLHDCMQLVFEDGPKRDRRLWMGDLRLQALANYQSYRNDDLVRRCLYLFAGSTLPGGRVSACLFTEPEVEADDTVMYDYSLFYAPTLLDYYEQTQDREVLAELWPVAWRQIELSGKSFDEEGLVRDSDVPGWCFVDWNLTLNKQASAQGIYLYCLRAAGKIAEILGDTDKAAWIKADYEKKKQAAVRSLYDDALGLFVSGADRQISWASQIWMVLGGVCGGEVLHRAAETEAVSMVTPYIYHHYVQALIDCGEKEKALEVLRSYWGGMVKEGADTFWELYNPDNPDESPYGGTIVNSYCHAWSCAPAYFLRKYY